MVARMTDPRPNPGSRRGASPRQKTNVQHLAFVHTRCHPYRHSWFGRANIWGLVTREEGELGVIGRQPKEPAQESAPARFVRSAEILSDQPISSPGADQLGFVAYAEALSEVIDAKSTVTPLTLSINAPWGAGKTSLARLVEHNLQEWPKLRGDPPHIVCWFNAWMHADAPRLGPALAAAPPPCCRPRNAGGDA